MNKEDNILGNMRENFTSEIRKSNRENFLSSKRRTYFEEEDESKEINVTTKEKLDFQVVLHNFLQASGSQVDDVISQFEISTNKALTETEFQMIDDNIIDKLLCILQLNEREILEKKLLRILANLTSGTSIVCEKLVKKGITDYFLSALERGFRLNDSHLLDISFWGLGNISGDNLSNRDLLFEKGIWSLLITNFSKVFDHKIEVARNGMWLFHNLLRDKHEKANYDLLQILPFLFAFCNLKYSDPYLLTDLAWTLLQLGNLFANGEKKNLFETEEIFVISRYLLSQKEMPILLPTLRFIVFLCDSRIKGFTKFVGREFFSETFHLLDYQMKIIKIEYIKMLRSMIQSDSRLCDLLIENESYPKKFLHVLEFDENQTKREMMKLLFLYTNNLEFLDYLLENGILNSLTKSLEKHEIEEVVLSSLDWIELFLESPFSKKVKDFLVNGPILKIEKLQKRKSQEIYSKAIYILEKYFDTEEES